MKTKPTFLARMLVRSSLGGDEVRASGPGNARPRQFQLNKPVIGWMPDQRSAVASGRWNYGADRRRERAARRWSEAELVPSWRELQPVLIRSAGVIGLAVTIMGVVVSDARRFGGDVALVNRSDRAEYPASGEAPPAPPVATTGAMVDELHAEAAQPVQASKDRLPEAVPEANVVEPPMPVAVVPVDDLQREAQAAPTGFAAPVNTASVSASAGMLAGTPPGAAETVAAVFASTPVGAAEPAAANPSIWLEGASCPRDWVAAGTSAGAAGCAAPAELVAALEEGAAQPALKEAVIAHAESLALLAPRIPAPRPGAVTPAKPSRVTRASSGRRLGPPPNCGAGHHAKWYFVDRKAGTKKWHCR